ncbi:Hypothetical protein PBC10988_35280 [Planctomycetales bacterium 10988]|nr:Hypothetical protein PBC10988_35280 [Planctomycetales bacterium 10988]
MESPQTNVSSNQPISDKEYPEDGFFEKYANAILWTLAIFMVVAVLGLIAYQYGSLMVTTSLVARAQERYQSGDYKGAIADLDQAAEWTPDYYIPYYVRATFRLEERQDVDLVLKDLDRMLEIDSSMKLGYLSRGMARKWKAMQVSGEERAEWLAQATEDLEFYQEFSSVTNYNAWNAVAYARGISEKKVEQGLEEANKSWEMLEREEKKFPSKEAYEIAQSNVLDTRGLLRFLNDKHDKALEDFDLAIELLERNQEKILKKLEEDGAMEIEVERQTEDLQHMLAVYYHHRGQVHEDLGHEEHAEEDFKRADELGYSPKDGIF